MKTVRDSINIETLKVALITLKKMKKLVKLTSKGALKNFTLYRNPYEFKKNTSFDSLFKDISSIVIDKKYPLLDKEIFYLEYKQYEAYLVEFFYNTIDTNDELKYDNNTLRKEIIYFHHLIDNILIDIGKKDHDFNKYSESLLYSDNVIAA